MDNTKSNTKNVRREIYKSAEIGYPELCYIGRYDYDKAYESLDTHAHKGAFEVCYLVKGQQIYQVGESQYSLRGGDVFVTFPDEAHGTGRNPEGKGELYWIVFTPPSGKNSWMGLDNHSSSQIFKTLFALKKRHFRGTAEMKNMLQSIFETLAADDGELKRVTVANQLTAFIIAVATEGAVEKGGGVQPFSNLIEYIDKHIEEDLSVPVLAGKTALSVSRFKALFKRFFGVPPAEFVLRRKVERAEFLLSNESRSVTDVAYSLGFSSSQYFATVFKRFTGKTPASFKR
ncbi:MAG: helix-turn-helix transcriptional regulator [Fibrobacteres bacterium]|nr:helix-turn-helix transcriptional regulator [Fibrobacterota bacterium]